MKHAVILMSFNRPRLVQEAMRSVLAQDGAQLVVVDDGSNEETLQAIFAIRDDVPGRVHVLPLDGEPAHRLNGGERSCAGIARAIRYLGSLDRHPDVVHYLPDDDLFFDGRFEAFDRAFTEVETAEWFYGRIVPLDADGTRLPDSRFGFDPFPGVPVPDPDCRIDCTQVGHRWECLDLASWNPPVNHEGHFFTQLAMFFGPALPLLTDAPVSGHRYHRYNLLTVQEKAGELPRE